MARSTVVLEIVLFSVLNINNLDAQTYITGGNPRRWEAHTGIFNHANTRSQPERSDRLNSVVGSLEERRNKCK